MERQNLLEYYAALLYATVIFVTFDVPTKGSVLARQLIYAR